MAKYSAQLKAISTQGKTVTTSISNINPEATAETILEFTNKLNALTNNTYDTTDYIVTTNLDTDEDTRTTTTFSMTSENTFLTGLSSSGKSTEFTTNSDGVISIAVNGNCGVKVGIITVSGIPKIDGSPQGNTSTAGTLTVRITGTETYKPFEQTYNFT